MKAFVVFLAVIIGCSGSQSGRWSVRADASLTVAAHALDTIDAIAAERYRAETSLPHPDLDAIDARYNPIRLARSLARTRMVAAERALTSGDCNALAALRLARIGVADVGTALAAAGIDEAPALATAVNAIVGVIEAGPVCLAGAQ